MDKLEVLILNLPIILWTIWVFTVGAVIGSLLNVCIARLPVEKSILWPMASHCGSCLHRIAWYDNIPLLSYWLLRGRCRHCRSSFSVRYFFVELLTALLITASFWFEVLQNIHGMPYFQQVQWNLRSGSIPFAVWVFMAHRTFLISLLIIAAVCDLNSREIPLGVTLFGTVVGLVFSVFLAWPWPNGEEAVRSILNQGLAWWLLDPHKGIPTGVYPWPPFELFGMWQPGSPLLGLVTGLAGAFTGTFMLRGIRFLFTRALGKEALGLGDADLMMMVGAFLGWQPVVVAFFLGAMVALVFAVVHAVIYRDHSLPFGPGLATGTVLTFFFWERLAPSIQPIVFNSALLGLLVVGGIGFMIVAGVVLRLTRRGENESPDK